MWPFFAYMDVAAMVCGFVANVLKFLAINKRTARNVRHYGNMVRICTVVDLLYTAVIVLCHQQIQIVDHKLLILSYGVENYIPWWPATILSSMEYFFLIEAVSILPVQFYYRYYLMTTTETNEKRKDYVLYGLFAVSVLVTLSVPTFAVMCHVKSIQRGKSYYESLLDPVFFDPHNYTEYAGAVDFADIEGWLFMGWGGVLIVASYFIMVHYGYKSIKGITPNIDTQQASEKVRRLTAQFTRNMIAQTVNSFFMAVLPMFVVVVFMFLGVNIHYGGVLIMSLVAWTPFTNAAVCFAIIKPYRDFILQRTRSSSHSAGKATNSVHPATGSTQVPSKH